MTALSDASLGNWSDQLPRRSVVTDGPSPSLFSPIPKKRASEVIVEQLEAMIYRGTLPPGSELPAERQLMVQLGVSRPTLREALRIAESTGLIATKAGGQGGQVVLGRPTVPVTQGHPVDPARRQGFARRRHRAADAARGHCRAARGGRP
jgi:DNA-binding transcriptional MocR family regulator